MTDEKNNGANLDFENKLWEMADKMRGYVNAAESKPVALGLVFSLARMRDTLLPKRISAVEKLFDD